MNSKNDINSKITFNIRLLTKSFIVISLLIISIFLIAGRIDYWQGWIYISLNIILLILTVIALRKKSDFIRERFKLTGGIKWWDKIFLIISTIVFIISIIIGCLDSGRFGWTPSLPIYIYLISIGGFIVGHSISLWAKSTNNFFSSVVRIQKERGHAVCQDGPYRFIRHPGYVGAILFNIITPIILGSLWTLIPMFFGVILIIIRTYLEDTMLKKELDGYVEYARKVKYRLLPGVW